MAEVTPIQLKIEHKPTKTKGNNWIL